MTNSNYYYQKSPRRSPVTRPQKAKESNPNKKCLVIWIVGIIIVIASCGIGVLIYIYASKKKSESASTKKDQKQCPLPKQEDEIPFKCPIEQYPSGVYDHTPLDKLNKNLMGYLEDKKKNPEYTFAVLLTTGALDPIHKGHTDIMEKAKTKIESDHPTIKVIGGFMSPSYDGYVSKKSKDKYGKDKHIPSKFRIKMVEMATADSLWITYDEWECKQNEFINFPEVASNLATKMKHLYCNKYGLINPSKLRIYYVCGLDHAEKCGLSSGLMQHGVYTLIVKRPNVESDIESNEQAGVVVVEVPPVEYDRSSTRVRELLKEKNWAELKTYLHASVLEYLKADPDKILRL